MIYLKSKALLFSIIAKHRKFTVGYLNKLLRLLLFIFFCFSAESVSAQDLISIANTFLNDKNYVEAKDAIDEAFEAPDAAQNPRAWYTKARVYHEILKSNNAELKATKANHTAFVAAVVEAYTKTVELTPETNNLHVLANNQLELMWADAINKGVSSFQEGKFDKAYTSFQTAQVSKPADTTAYIYAGLSAQNAGLYDEAIATYLALKDFSKLDKSVYNGLILSSQAAEKPLEQQLDFVEDAVYNYPNHVPYIVQQVRLLVNLNRFTEAESILNTAIKRNPNNGQLVLRQADLYDRIFKEAFVDGEPEKSDHYFEMASEKYERYLSAFPNEFTANYNYSVMINERANRVYIRINLMSKDEYDIRGKEVEEVGHEWTRKALPYMEKAKSIKPDDEKVITALKVYYERLSLVDKLKQLNDEH